MSGTRIMRLTPALVAHCHRKVETNADQSKYDYYTDADYDRAIEHVLGGRPAGAFWLFAYGSLIWKPEFEALETRRATAQGWHRAFSLLIHNYRGSPEQPGYMMCLDRGGSCDGVVLRLGDEELRKNLHVLLFREIGSDEALASVRWIDVATREGPLSALGFYAGPDQLDYYTAARPMAEVVHGLARACGHWGSGADYLYNTVSHLEAIGIHDDYLWTLQELVADEIEAL